MKKLPCICGHRSDKHSKSNGKSMERLNRQLKGYQDTLANREKFWKEFLSNIKLEEFGCGECKCESFKQDNLKYLEDLYEVKKEN